MMIDVSRFDESGVKSNSTANVAAPSTSAMPTLWGNLGRDDASSYGLRAPAAGGRDRSSSLSSAPNPSYGGEPRTGAAVDTTAWSNEVDGGLPGVSVSAWTASSPHVRRGSLNPSSLFSADMQASLPRLEEQLAWRYEQRPRSKTVDEGAGAPGEDPWARQTASQSASAMPSIHEYGRPPSGTGSAPSVDWSPFGGTPTAWGSAEDEAAASRRRSASMPLYREDEALSQQHAQMLLQPQGPGAAASSWRTVRSPPTNDVSGIWAASAMRRMQDSPSHMMSHQYEPDYSYSGPSSRTSSGNPPPLPPGFGGPATSSSSSSPSIRNDRSPIGFPPFSGSGAAGDDGYDRAAYDYASRARQYDQSPVPSVSAPPSGSAAGSAGSTSGSSSFASVAAAAAGVSPSPSASSTSASPSGAARPRSNSSRAGSSFAPVFPPDASAEWQDDYELDMRGDDSYGAERSQSFSGFSTDDDAMMHGGSGSQPPAHQRRRAMTALGSTAVGAHGHDELAQGVEFYRVEFKNGRASSYFVEDTRRVKFKVGDWVLVEADRGKDLGRVTGRGTEFADKDAKAICRLAHPPETAQMSLKLQDEIKALALCQTKCRLKKLPMEVVDAEYQWDRRKLTYYFVADRRIDFRELVRELFKVYKTRIWMCSVEDPTKRVGVIKN